MIEEPKKIVTDEQLQKTLLALARGHGTDRFTQDDAEVAYDWLIDLVVSASMLELVMDEEVTIRVDPVRGVVMSIRDKPQS